MTSTAKRDGGRGLDQVKLTPSHWRIEGYDVYVTTAWEGTHTSRSCEIEKDGELVERIERGISEARAWIREQVGK